MTYAMNNDKVFKIVRETPKTLFYKVVIPAKMTYVSYFNDFGSSKILSFKKYSLEDSTIVGNEYKVLKSKFDTSKVIEENNLLSYFYINDDKYLINQDIIDKHLFFNDDNYKLLEIAFELKGLVFFFTSPSTLQRIGENDVFWNVGNQEKLRNFYNNKLKEFHEFYEKHHYDIQNNLDKIKYTIYFQDNLNDGSDFEQKLNEALQLEEVH